MSEEARVSGEHKRKAPPEAVRDPKAQERKLAECATISGVALPR